MQLSKLALDKIKGSTQLRLKIALALGVGEKAIEMAVKRNSGTLTKYACIQVIKSETGLSDEEIIVTENSIA